MAKAEVVSPVPKYDSEALAAIESFDDAVRLAGETAGTIARADKELGDGFKLLDNAHKDSLVGVELLLMSWSFHPGDHGEFVAVKVVTRDGRKLVLNDGSTGVYAQLVDYSNKTNRFAAMHVPNGLRRSDYTFTNEEGVEKPASTFYLDVSAA